MLQHPADLPALSQSFHTPNFNSPDSFALEIAAVMLAGGKSARLYQKLVVEKRMVVDVGAGYDRQSFDPGLFTIAAQMRPGVKADDVLEELDHELSRLREKPIGTDELQKAKNQEQAGFLFGQDSILRQAMELGVYEMLGSYKMYDDYLAGINRVTADDVRRVARQYLVAANCTVGVLVPTGLLNRPGAANGESGGVIRHAQDMRQSPL
jgi:zinc protease